MMATRGSWRSSAAALAAGALMCAAAGPARAEGFWGDGVDLLGTQPSYDLVRATPASGPSAFGEDSYASSPRYEAVRAQRPVTVVRPAAAAPRARYAVGPEVSAYQRCRTRLQRVLDFERPATPSWATSARPADRAQPLAVRRSQRRACWFVDFRVEQSVADPCSGAWRTRTVNRTLPVYSQQEARLIAAYMAEQGQQR